MFGVGMGKNGRRSTGFSPSGEFAWSCSGSELVIYGPLVSDDDCRPEPRCTWQPPRQHSRATLDIVEAAPFGWGGFGAEQCLLLVCSSMLYAIDFDGKTLMEKRLPEHLVVDCLKPIMSEAGNYSLLAFSGANVGLLQGGSLTGDDSGDMLWAPVLRRDDGGAHHATAVVESSSSDVVVAWSDGQVWVVEVGDSDEEVILSLTCDFQSDIGEVKNAVLQSISSILSEYELMIWIVGASKLILYRVRKSSPVEIALSFDWNVSSLAKGPYGATPLTGPISTCGFVTGTGDQASLEIVSLNAGGVRRRSIPLTCSCCGSSLEMVSDVSDSILIQTGSSGLLALDHPSGATDSFPLEIDLCVRVISGRNRGHLGLVEHRSDSHRLYYYAAETLSATGLEDATISADSVKSLWGEAGMQLTTIGETETRILKFFQLGILLGLTPNLCEYVSRQYLGGGWAFQFPALLQRWARNVVWESLAEAQEYCAGGGLNQLARVVEKAGSMELLLSSLLFRLRSQVDEPCATEDEYVARSSSAANALKELQIDVQEAQAAAEMLRVLLFCMHETGSGAGRLLSIGWSRIASILESRDELLLKDILERAAPSQFIADALKPSLPPLELRGSRDSDKEKDSERLHVWNVACGYLSQIFLAIREKQQQDMTPADSIFDSQVEISARSLAQCKLLVLYGLLEGMAHQGMSRDILSSQAVCSRFASACDVKTVMTDVAQLAWLFDLGQPSEAAKAINAVSKHAMSLHEEFVVVILTRLLTWDHEQQIIAAASSALSCTSAKEKECVTSVKTWLIGGQLLRATAAQRGADPRVRGTLFQYILQHAWSNGTFLELIGWGLDDFEQNGVTNFLSSMIASGSTQAACARDLLIGFNLNRGLVAKAEAACATNMNGGEASLGSQTLLVQAWTAGS